MAAKSLPPEERKLRRVYRQCRNNSARRRIAFLFSYEDWRRVWLESGHWAERGRGNHQFCMARIGDRGPYKLGNVKIISNHDNKTEYRPKPETLALISTAMVGNDYASGNVINHTTEAKAKMRLAASRRSRDQEGRFI